MFIVQLFYSIVLKNIVKQEWKSSKKNLAVQCVIKQPFCIGFLLGSRSNCHHGKHEQGMEFGCLTMIFNLFGSDWSVNSEKNMLVEAIKGTINLEVNVSFSNGKTGIQCESQRSYTPMPKDYTRRMFWWILRIVVLNFNTVSWFNV